MQSMYDKYYWQNDKVRLRAVRPDEGVELLDSEAWTMASEEVVLPFREGNTKAGENKFPIPAFSIENLEGEYVGIIHFNEIDERHGTFELGMMLVRKFRNKGYGKSAMKLLLEYAFNERRLNKCNADCIDCNVASVSLIKSLGFKQEGEIRESIFLGGVFRNRLLFGMTVKEYREIQAQEEIEFGLQKNNYRRCRPQKPLGRLCALTQRGR